MTDKKIELKSNLVTEFVKSPDHKNIYVNASRMSISAWDIRIGLGQIGDPYADKTVNEELLSVFMSPAHAKAMLVNFQQTIQAYEDNFGEIISPEAVAQSASAMMKLSELANSPVLPKAAAKPKKKT